MARAARKTADVILRCDGGAVLGLGHLKRCLAAAAHLSRDQGMACLFAGRFDPPAAALIETCGFPVAPWEPADPEAAWLIRLAEERQARAVIFDIRTGLEAAVLESLRFRHIAIVTLDDASPRRLAADLALLPPTPLALSLDWTGFRGEALIGWAWTVLAAKPAPRAVAAELDRPLSLLLTMGGSDPAGLTLRAARLLLPLSGCVTPVFVIGPAFEAPTGQIRQLQSLWAGAEIANRPETLASLMSKADLALAAYGVTAQELAAAGVPSLYLGLSDDHVQSADALAATGAGISLGRHDALSDAAIREAVSALIGDPARRKAMALAGPKAIDGRGAARLAARIAGLIRLRKSA